MLLISCSGGEMANAVDSKSTDSDILRVQVPFWAPFIYQKPRSCGFFVFLYLQIHYVYLSLYK